MRILSFVLVLFLVLTTQTVKAQTADVTAKVKASITGGSLSISVDNDTLGGDPAPTLVKKLKVEYTVDKIAASKVVMEGGMLKIQVPADKMLVIIKATYGNLPDKIIDVTDKLVAAVNNDALTISADNGTLGGDPAPTITKELHVDYTVKGVAHTATASENDTLTLPLGSDGNGSLVIVKAEYGDFAPVATSSGGPIILTPATPSTPQIHGPKVFGVRPGSPFIYTIPATGNRPMQFSADGVPLGLKMNANGQITGTLTQVGTYQLILHARNDLGQADRPFKIMVGDQIGLTPAMGWNSFNTYDVKVTQEQILTAAHAMVDSGLAQHGWTYINCDDGWQGARGGDLNAIQSNEGFPDIAGMVNEIHGLGLKAGIYSTPWVTSYGRRIGGSSEDPQGKWDPSFANNKDNHSQKFPYAIATYHFAVPDAKQIAAWGFDYLKYDWAPIHAADTKEMSDALHDSGRDIIFSLSNNGLHTLLNEIGDVAPLANSWRTTDDVHDNWKNISNSAYNEDAWATYAGPGHFNDPDMLVIGPVGWGHPHPSLLTPDEQYTQISMWCLLSAPLILGCDLSKLDPFTTSLITNDEVLDIDQDSLGKQATCVSQNGDAKVYAKPLEDGSWAVGLCNTGMNSATVTLKWDDLKLAGNQVVRDLWRQKDLGTFDKEFSSPVSPHGVVLLRITRAHQ